MLVVTRNTGDAIRIGQNIHVKVIQVGENRVALGIEAPREIGVWRAEAPSPDDEAPPSSARETRHVLIVDDTPAHATLIEKALQKSGGFTCEISGTMREAMERLRRGQEDPGSRPDLVLLDLRLADGSGLEILEWIRKADKLRTIPVIMLSCADSETDVARCLDAGANAFIAKPETYETFRDSIHRIAHFWSSTCRVP